MKSSTIKLTSIVFLSVLIEIVEQKEIPACGLLGPIVIPTMLNSYTTHRWPWHAAIYHIAGEQKYQCGGTVITSDSILTAAHCVSKYGQIMKKTQIIVSLGRLTLSANESSARELKVIDIILHPEYGFEGLMNDIAIIRLSKCTIFNNYVQPICLWNSSMSEVVGKSGTVIGWGETERGEKSNELLQASLPVVSWMTCLKSSRAVAATYLSEHKFCAGRLNGTGICRGDSGGPMMFEENGSYYIRGIMSSSQGIWNYTTNTVECDATKYAYFTDVAHFLPWIKDEIDLGEENLSSFHDMQDRDDVILDENHICPDSDPSNPDGGLDEENLMWHDVESYLCDQGIFCRSSEKDIHVDWLQTLESQGVFESCL